MDWPIHTLRRPTDCIARKALWWNQRGNRWGLRPRNSWMRDTEHTIQSKGHSWKQIERLARDRADQRSFVSGLCSEMEQSALKSDQKSNKSLRLQGLFVLSRFFIHIRVLELHKFLYSSVTYGLAMDLHHGLIHIKAVEEHQNCTVKRTNYQVVALSSAGNLSQINKTDHDRHHFV